MTRDGFVRHFRLGTAEFYARFGQYDDGRAGELFVTQAGESGSHVATLLDTIGVLFSLCVQCQVPLGTLAGHMRGMRAGDVCGTPSADEIAAALSLPDALARIMALPRQREMPGPPPCGVRNSPCPVRSGRRR
jgi:hypothetical protein